MRGLVDRQLRERVQGLAERRKERLVEHREERLAERHLQECVEMLLRGPMRAQDARGSSYQGIMSWIFRECSCTPECSGRVRIHRDVHRQPKIAQRSHKALGTAP